MVKQKNTSSAAGAAFENCGDDDLGNVVAAIAHEFLIAELGKHIPATGDEVGEKRFLKKAEPVLLEWIKKMRTANRLSGLSDEVYSPAGCDSKTYADNFSCWLDSVDNSAAMFGSLPEEPTKTLTGESCWLRLRNSISSGR